MWFVRLSRNASNGNVGDADGVPDMISASSRIPLEVLDVPYRVWSRQSAGAPTDLTNTTGANQPPDLTDCSQEFRHPLDENFASTHSPRHPLPQPRTSSLFFHRPCSRRFENGKRATATGAAGFRRNRRKREARIT